MSQPDPLRTIQELADQLGVPVTTVYRWRSAGKPCPRAIRVGKHLRFRQSAIDAFLDAQAEPASA